MFDTTEGHGSGCSAVVLDVYGAIFLTIAFRLNLLLEL